MHNYGIFPTLKLFGRRKTAGVSRRGFILRMRIKIRHIEQAFQNIQILYTILIVFSIAFTPYFANIY